MEIKINGTIAAYQKEKNGVSASGAKWRRAEVVIQFTDNGQFKKVALKASNGKLEIAEGLGIGQSVEATFEINGFDWNGILCNSIELVRINKRPTLDTPNNTDSPAYYDDDTRRQAQPAAPAPEPVEDNPSDDLPF